MHLQKNNNMKTILLVLFSFIVTDYSCIKDFEFVKAESQKWHGGRPETGYGTKYVVTLISKKDSEIMTFDKMWVGEDCLDIRVSQKGRKVREGVFSKGTEITIAANHRVVPESKSRLQPISKEDQAKIDSLKIPAPIKYKGEALLSYTVKGKKKYFVVEKFTIIEPVYYP